MCMNCGCMMPDDAHGEDKNITLSQLQEAARANDQDLDETLDNIERTYHQSVEGSQQGGQASRHEHSY